MPGKRLRYPWVRRVSPNLPNTDDKRGSRLYVRAGANRVRRILGRLVLKVRTVGDGVVEVIHTEHPAPWRIGWLLHKHGLLVCSRPPWSVV